MSYSLDPDQARHFDLGPNCLQKLLADDTSWQRVKIFHDASSAITFYRQRITKALISQIDMQAGLPIVCMQRTSDFPLMRPNLSTF